MDEYYAGGPLTFQEAFPPACITSHWDPTAVSDYVLPWGDRLGAQSMDPRPAARICAQYYTQSEGDAPMKAPEGAGDVFEMTAVQGGLRTLDVGAAPSAAAAVPPGGAAGFGVPYKGYNVAAESDVLRLDEGLTKCKERRYQPRDGVVADATNIIPGVSAVPEGEFATIVSRTAGCREADDAAAWDRSGRLFNNSTKTDRYVPTARNGSLACSQAFSPTPQ